MPPKRTATQASLLTESQAANKRYKQVIDEVADEHVCPITFELPIDPVTAEDGRVYERCAIEEWFDRQPQPQVKSPVTNEPMGKRLLLAVQIRNTLTRLVESGVIGGSKADAWKQGMANQAQVAALRTKAEAGEAHAMGRLGFSYRDGTRRLKLDLTQSFMWFKRAAELNDVTAMMACGVAYLRGEGVTRSDTRGLVMLGMAAMMGSSYACYVLGRANEKGRYGFDKDPQDATRWYRKMQKCDDSGIYTGDEKRDREIEIAAAWLREHP